MKCIKKRTIFDLFEVYKCDDCIYYKSDERFCIGRVNIQIIYADSYCFYYKECQVDKDIIILNNKKIRLFLKDCIISKLFNYEIIILWVDEYSVEQYGEIIDILIDFGLDIYVLTNF